MTELTQRRRTIYVPEAGGARRVIEGSTVVAAFGDGRELRFEFSRHPSEHGRVTVISQFVAPGEDPDADRRGRLPGEVAAAIHICPGGGNVMLLAADARRWSDGSEVVAAGAAGGGEALFSVRNGVRTPVDSTTVVLDFDDGSDLTIHFGDAPPPLEGARRRTTPGWAWLTAGPDLSREEYQALVAGRPFPSSSLELQFGATNVIHVAVIRDDRICLPGDVPRPPVEGT